MMKGNRPALELRSCLPVLLVTRRSSVQETLAFFVLRRLGFSVTHPDLDRFQRILGMLGV